MYNLAPCNTQSLMDNKSKLGQLWKFLSDADKIEEVKVELPKNIETAEFKDIRVDTKNLMGLGKFKL